MEEALTLDKRNEMVASQLVHRDIRDERLLEVMRRVPRHRFVPQEYRDQAYSDGPLPIGYGQTISQPYIVAFMTQILRLTPDDVVLEVGTGSGYQAAVLAGLVKVVYTLERHAPLAERARGTLAELDIPNVDVIFADGSAGYPEKAPYDAIMVTAAAPDTPQILLDQLNDGGRLVIPVGRRWEQTLHVWTRRGGSFEKHISSPVVFVPLRGKFGWGNDAWSEEELE